jgi:hypothetical protein
VNLSQPCVSSSFAGFKDFFKLGELDLSFQSVDRPKHLTNWLDTATAASFAALTLRGGIDIAPQPVELDFEAYVKWDIEDLSRGWAHRMINNTNVPQTSAVGVMSSIQLQHLLNKWIPDVVCAQFRLLVYTSSLMYNLGRKESSFGCTWSELRMTQSQAGNALIQNLEKLLRPCDLAKAYPEKLRVLFLILFGTILAVGYSDLSNNNATIKVSQPPEA